MFVLGLYNLLKEIFMRKLYLLIAFMVLACSVVMANDSVFFVNGNQLIPSENETDISVQKEVLTISLQDDGKTKVNVYYEFNNKSDKAKTVLMGFEANPPYNADCKYNAKGIHPYISNFSVNMNGKDVSYSNAVVELNTPQGFKPLDTKAWKTGEAFDESNGQMLDNGNLSINFAYAYYFKATFEPGLNKIVHG